MKILTVSSANMDLNMRVPVSPEKGETLMGISYKYVSGGKGANSATAVAKLGGESIFCAALGNDANGSTLRSIYEDTGIITDYIFTHPTLPTGLATVTVEADGANRIVVFSGANGALAGDYAIEVAKKTSPDAVFCHFEIPYDTVAALSHYCDKQGIPMFIDAGPADKNLDLSKLAPVFVFSPNETETEIFTGIAPNDEESCVLAAKKLMETVKAKYYVLKLGGRGVGVYDGENLTLIPTYPVKVVDTTSAGDSFTAAMTLEYMRSGDILHACRYGNAVASITVSRAGAGESIPNSDELAAFLKENGIVL
jgi:ribokinase